jgi:virulence-associated protein VagC
MMGADGDAIAKIFWASRSQAARLTKEYRFEGSKVRVARKVEGEIFGRVFKPRVRSNFEAGDRFGSPVLDFDRDYAPARGRTDRTL